MTPIEAISQALKKAGVIGIGETPAAEDYNDAFIELQNMLSQWQQERWLVYGLQDVAFVSNGAISNTIGIGGDFNVLRPDTIDAAYFVNLNQQGNLPVSYNLQVLRSHEDYAKIALKTLNSWPMYVFYDTSTYPLGNIYVNPIPQAGLYEIHLLVKTPLPQPVDQATQMSLPPEYNQAIIYNLAALLCTSYGLPVPADLRAMASNSLNRIRIANTQIPHLKMPRELTGNKGIYNIFSDRVQ